jgi:glycosyltransferase involved in cell wall biosynthesis
LLLLGNVEDNTFFEKDVKPHLNEKIQWISPVSSEQSHSQIEIRDLLQGAKALIFPTKFEESFGLVAAEAMSCGTPVITFVKGSLPDIVDDQKTGFIVDASVDGLCDGIKRICALSKNEYQTMQKNARQKVEENFTIEKMVSGYEALYKQILQDGRK